LMSKALPVAARLLISSWDWARAASESIGMAGNSKARAAAQQALARRGVRRGPTGRELAGRRRAAEARGLVTEAPRGI